MAPAVYLRSMVQAATVLIMITVTPQWSFAEQPQSAPPLLFQHSGLRVHVDSPSGEVSNEQALSALEESARQLRRQIDAEKNPTDNSNRLPSRSVLIFPDDHGGAGDDYTGTDLEGDWKFTLFPNTLLWQPALANPSEPRFYAKPSTLRNSNTEDTIDTSIGAVAGLYRFSPLGAPEQGVQFDVFAVVLSRWTQRSYQVNSDYRYGFPLTFAWGNMHAKIGYEHTSSHLGDDAMERTGRTKFRNIHDDLVFGLDYRFFNALRVYGVYAYPLLYKTPDDRTPHRFNWGVEWSQRATTSIYGQPFAAFDMTLRDEQGYTPNSTTQIGWQWLNMENGHSTRLALEYYDGTSNLGQFYLDRERWTALGLYFDF